MHRTFAIVCLAILATSTSTIHAQSLRGSAASMDKQHGMAVDHDYTFLTRAGDVDRFTQLGLLVPIRGGTNYELHAVSFPYARPAVRTFVERLSAQYRAACGERLVVTSLTRPTTRQPRNASDISVHPTGMAVDLRISNRSSCRRWLESTLLALEKSGVLEATREQYPAHYHVAIFPHQYTAYVDLLVSRSTTRLASTSSAAPTVTAAESETERVSGPSADTGPSTATHRVAGGESLWSIARQYDTTVGELMALNGLTSSRIRPGQTLTVDAVAGAAGDGGVSGPSADPVPAVTSHRVARGESLWSIAREHGTTVDELKAANGLTSSGIRPGQTLTVAAAGGASGPASSAMTATYRVSRGDTLWSIARAHDMTVAELKALNGLGSSSIKAGQTLTVSAR